MNPLNPLAPYITMIKWALAIALPAAIFAAGYLKGHAPVDGLRSQIKSLSAERDQAKDDADAKGRGLAIALEGLASAELTFRQMDARAQAQAAAADRMQAKGERAAAEAVKENIKLHGDIAAMNKAIELERGYQNCNLTGVPLQ